MAPARSSLRSSSVLAPLGCKCIWIAIGVSSGYPGPYFFRRLRGQSLGSKRVSSWSDQLVHVPQASQCTNGASKERPRRSDAATRPHRRPFNEVFQLAWQSPFLFILERHRYGICPLWSSRAIRWRMGNMFPFAAYFIRPRAVRVLSTRAEVRPEGSPHPMPTHDDMAMVRPGFHEWPPDCTW
jgi:hypothetical protein